MWITFFKGRRVAWREALANNDNKEKRAFQEVIHISTVPTTTIFYINIKYIEKQ
jgi:hypothetical protein